MANHCCVGLSEGCRLMFPALAGGKPPPRRGATSPSPRHSPWGCGSRSRTEEESRSSPSRRRQTRLEIPQPQNKKPHFSAEKWGSGNRIHCPTTASRPLSHFLSGQVAVDKLESKRGPDRSRTDDGGFAIRCLSHLATGPNTTSSRSISSTELTNRYFSRFDFDGQGACNG